MALRPALALAAFLAALILSAPAHAAAGLRWAPPVLDDPVTITIASNARTGYVQDPAFHGTGFDPARDYVVRCDPKTDGHIVAKRIALKGGRNVVLRGCFIQRQAATPVSAYPPVGKACPRIANPVGLFSAAGMRLLYMEGVLFDLRNTATDYQNYGVDAIDLGDGDAPGIAYVLQDIRITGVWSTACGQHADGIQNQGPIGRLYIDRLTIVTGYQGLTLEPAGGGGFPLRDGRIYHVNTRYIDPDYSHKNAHGDSVGANGYSWWQGDGRAAPSRVNTVYFVDNYAEYRSHFHDLPWCQSSVGPPCRTAFGNTPASGEPDIAQFPSSYIDSGGHPSSVRRGPPPSGDFVPADMIVDAGGRVVYRPATSFDNPSP